MSNWAGGVLTKAGRVLQAKVETGIPLRITKIKLGDGLETIGEVDNLINLVSPKVTLGVSSATQSGQTATITGVVTSTTLSQGFYCREWGLFAVDPDVGEILYMISIDSAPEWLPPSTEIAKISATYAMNIAVANATNIIVSITPAGLVDVDMLMQYTHSVDRSTKYREGDIVNAPGLRHGLLLDCRSGGTTSESLVDFSQVGWGGDVLDGNVQWNAGRIMLAPSDLYCYSPSWMVKALQRLILFAQSVQRNAAEIVTPDGRTVYLGGSGRDVDVTNIISDEPSGGTFFLELSFTRPESMEYAWLKTEHNIGTTFNARPIFRQYNGAATIGATKIQIVREDGSVFYIDTITRPPRHYGGGVPPYDMATDAEVEQMLNEALPLNQ